MKKCTVIINPTSGKGLNDELAEKISSVLENYNYESKVIITEYSGHAEEIIQKAMDKLTEDRTSFVIAHRLSTIKDADRIAVINQGKLVELGNHTELMEIENGQYKTLYNMQFKKQEVNV